MGLLAYVTPVTIPLAARFAHEAYHAVHELQRSSGTAWLLGTGWVDPQQAPETEPRMHMHGDGTPAHAHSTSLDLLLAVSDSEADLLPSLPQPDRLSAHVPAASILLAIQTVAPIADRCPPSSRFDGRSLQPPLRPPRV